MAVTKYGKIRVNSGYGKLEKQKKSRPQSAHTSSARKESPGLYQPTENLQVYQSLVTKERWKEIKKMTDKAIHDKKVFLIRGGGFSAVRKALLARGWIQKFDSNRKDTNLANSCYLASDSQTQANGENSDKATTKCENLIMHKLLEEQPIDFLWTSRREGNDWLLAKSDVIISKFGKAYFTSKEGLCTYLNQMYWFDEPGVSQTNFPRCYNIHFQEQMDDFIDNFRLTACIGMLKWLVATYIAEGEDGIIKENSRIPLSSIDFAIRRLVEYVHFVTHKDIDDLQDKSNIVWEFEWDQFLTHHFLVIHEHERFNKGTKQKYNLEELYRKATKILKSLHKYWPQMDIDGMMNIWIVKPGNKCRGRGIHLMNNMKKIIAMINTTPSLKSRYVVQKYIETPLTIYNTKFDIRQWFLVTCSEPLTIWMYKDSYLRFSTQFFDLGSYHESIHLTNNAVQCKYKNNEERDKALPEENMWDCHRFKAYLRQIGSSGMWEEKIYPGMKECLIGAMVACQDTLDRRANSFELYGADFMLTEDFTPWLIEINSSPDFAPTTSVTARMCPQCLEDVIKVVVDTRDDPEADTGLFELVYKQVLPKGPAYFGLSLSISGRKLVGVSKKKNEKEKAKLETDPVPDTVNREDNDSSSMMRELMSWLYPSNLEIHSEIVKANKEPDNKPPAQDDSASVQDTLKIVKSGLSLKSCKSVKKFKACNKKEKSSKTKSLPMYCCKLDSSSSMIINKEVKKPLKKGRSYWQDPNEIKSVGNKRCYIEPAIWEKDTASILRSLSTRPSEAKIENKQFQQVTPRIFSPGIIASPHVCSRFKKFTQKNEGNEVLNGSISLKVIRLKRY